MADDGENISGADLALLDDKAPAAPVVDASKAAAPVVDPAKPVPVDAKADTKAPDKFGDWRDQALEKLSEPERPKAREYLRRQSGIDSLARSAMSADAKISELTKTRVKVPTGKDDKPEDLAAWNKVLGVPEKPDAYKFDPPKDYGEFTEFDKDLTREFLDGAYKVSLNQRQVDYVKDYYWQAEQRKGAEKAAAAIRADTVAEENLRAEHGREFSTKVELVNRWLGEGLEKHGLTREQRAEFLNMRMENGRKLGSFEPLVNWLMDEAVSRADDGAFVVGEMADGVDLDKKIDDMMQLSHSNPKEYARMQPELMRMIAAQERRGSRR